MLLKPRKEVLDETTSTSSAKREHHRSSRLCSTCHKGAGPSRARFEGRSGEYAIVSWDAQEGSAPRPDRRGGRGSRGARKGVKPPYSSFVEGDAVSGV